MTYFHYTKGCHLPSIVKCDIINTSDVLLDKKEKPAVWLTKSPVWESACNIGQRVSTEKLATGTIYSSDEVESVTVSDDYMKKEIGMCRILISESLPVVSWADFKHVSGISEFMYNAIDSHSRSIDCPVEEWICSFNPIPKKYWEGIEMFVDDQWVRWDEIIPIEKYVSLCLSCNGKSDESKTEIIRDERVYQEVYFINKYTATILTLWLRNRDKPGYIEAIVKPDYTPHDSGIRFNEKRFKKSSFHPLGESKAETYAYVLFVWEATNTQSKFAIPYEIDFESWNKSFNNEIQC
jgi:hypothetical protein